MFFTNCFYIFYCFYIFFIKIYKVGISGKVRELTSEKFISFRDSTILTKSMEIAFFFFKTSPQAKRNNAAKNAKPQGLLYLRLKESKRLIGPLDLCAAIKGTISNAQSYLIFFVNLKHWENQWIYRIRTLLHQCVSFRC